MTGFSYVPDKDVFVHNPTLYIFDADYISRADNEEIKTKFYESTGYVLDDFGIGMMRARRSHVTTV